MFRPRGMRGAPRSSNEKAIKVMKCDFTKKVTNLSVSGTVLPSVSYLILNSTKDVSTFLSLFSLEITMYTSVRLHASSKTFSPLAESWWWGEARGSHPFQLLVHFSSFSCSFQENWLMLVKMTSHILDWHPDLGNLDPPIYQRDRESAST